MPEFIEEPEATRTQIDPERYLDLIRRRHVPFLLALFVGWLAIWAASWILPARYKSTTLILVQEPSMPKNYVTPNVSDDLQDRLQSITQQILSRTRLLTIITKLHLYQDTKRKLTPEDQVTLMRKDIDIELVRDSRTEEISAFRINFSARDPRIAQSVTAMLTDLFINENLRTRQQESEDTTNFIKDQLDSARSNLAAQEAKVRDFESQHEGELPSQQPTNLTILAGLQSQLQNEQDALNSARQQRAYFEALLGQYATPTSATHTTAEPLQTTSPTAALDQQLDVLQAKLANLKSRYTDRYPDVLATQDEITKVEAMRQEVLSSSKNKATKGGGSAGAAAGTSVLSPLAQVRGQLEANQLEIANREQTIASLKARINEYQGRLNAVPATQQQLADLTRGYDQSKQNYDDLLKKESESEMATSMEQMQQGERFIMLDPPSLPLKPDFPNRLKFCGLGLAAGVGFGVLLVLALEFLDKRMYVEKEIRALLPVPVIAAIPEIRSTEDVKRERGKMVLGWSVAVVIILVIAAGSAYSYLHA